MSVGPFAHTDVGLCIHPKLLLHGGRGACGNAGTEPLLSRVTRQVCVDLSWRKTCAKVSWRDAMADGEAPHEKSCQRCRYTSCSPLPLKRESARCVPMYARLSPHLSM